MMSLNNLNIYLPEINKSYGFCYYFNLNSSFDNLLESFSYNFPDLKICPCYKIEVFNAFNNAYFKVNMKEKVNKYFNSYNQYQLIRKNKCTCDKLVKNFFWTPKLKILSKMNDYMKDLEKYKLEISQYNSKEKKILEDVEFLKHQVSWLKNERDALKNKTKKFNELTINIENIERQEIEQKKQIEKLTIENEKLVLNINYR